MTSNKQNRSNGISVIIPSYNPDPGHLAALYQSLLTQTWPHFEVIVVDDGSTRADYALPEDPRFRILRQPENRGPAACRNTGVEAARYDLVFFTDTDCVLAPKTLETTARWMENEDVVMGNTVTRAETRFGHAVALLGFPGGGNIGFDKVWRVDPDGYTNSFSSCNVAFRITAFNDSGRFDESFPVPGGEDTVLARKIIASGRRIRYCPDQLVYHIEKKTLREFIQWQLTRGRGNYYIKQHAGRVGGYLWLRVWTFKNSLKAAGLRYAPFVLILILLSVYYQIKGYRREKIARIPNNFTINEP